MNQQEYIRIKDTLGEILQRMETLLHFREEHDGWIKQELRELVLKAKGVLNTQMSVIPIPVMPEPVSPLPVLRQPRSEPVMLSGMFQPGSMVEDRAYAASARDLPESRALGRATVRMGFSMSGISSVGRGTPVGLPVIDLRPRTDHSRCGFPGPNNRDCQEQPPVNRKLGIMSQQLLRIIPCWIMLSLPSAKIIMTVMRTMTTSFSCS